MTTGGPPNYPPLVVGFDIMPNPNAPTEQLVQFLYPALYQADMQAAIDGNSPAFAANGVSAVSLTQPSCPASPTGVCAPGNSGCLKDA